MDTGHQYAIEAAQPVAADCLPGHLTPLVEGEWAVWRWFVLRGTGFPVERMSDLSFPHCAAAADRLLNAEASAKISQSDAIAAVNQILDRFRQKGITPDDDRFRATLTILRQIRAGRAPAVAAGTAFEGVLAAYTKTLQEQTARQAEFDQLFSHSLELQSRELRTVAHDPLFQEAIIWQSRQAFESGVRPLLERSNAVCGRNKKERQREELVANYLQRYCLKSETIGFFGPVAWGRLDPDSPVLEPAPGKNLVQKRTTYFEDWAIASVAERLSTIPELKWWTPPRIAPYFQQENRTLHSARSGPVMLDELAAALLPMCDGWNLPPDILAALAASAGFRNLTRQQLCDRLEELAAQGILVWRFLTPIEANAEVNLRSQLFRVRDPLLRQEALSALDRLESTRNAVSAAAGNAVQLNSALSDLEINFEEITRTPAQRNCGATYAARTIVYEDCQRDLVLAGSPELFRPVLPALSLLLRSLRWFVQAAGAAFHDVLQQPYRELSGGQEAAEIPATALASRIGAQVAESPSLQELERAFRNKWAEILCQSMSTAVVQFNSVEIRTQVEKAFPDLKAPCQPVLYYCPDMMISAPDAETIRRGEGLYVLSELHVAKNTLTSTLFVEQHPAKQELFAATAWDCHPESFKILPSRKWQRLTVRTNEGIFCPKDFLLATVPEAVAPTGLTSHPISDLSVCERGGRLTVKSPDGRCFDVLEAFADLFFSYLMHKASWLPELPHTPCVAIDRLVIQRESWRFPASSLQFALEKLEHLRFLGARKWKREHCLPEVMFVKTPLETKPFYVDLSSPIYVEILSKMVRRLVDSSFAGQEIIFSEMLPTTLGAWLQDAGGARYASEFRFALVDLTSRNYRVAKTREGSGDLRI